MDSVDKNILEILKKDGRISLSEISNKVGLSIPAVRERIKKMEVSGAIKQYSVILNNEFFGKNLDCYCKVELNPTEGASNIFKEFILAEDAIIECYTITGDYEFLVHFLTEDTKSLEKLIFKMRDLGIIKRSNTQIVLSKMKG